MTFEQTAPGDIEIEKFGLFIEETIPALALLKSGIDLDLVISQTRLVMLNSTDEANLDLQLFIDLAEAFGPVCDVLEAVNERMTGLEDV